MGRKPMGASALSNTERQKRFKEKINLKIVYLEEVIEKFVDLFADAEEAGYFPEEVSSAFLDNLEPRHKEIIKL